MKLSQVIGFNARGFSSRKTEALEETEGMSSTPRLGRELVAEPDSEKQKTTTTVLCNHALDDTPFNPHNFMDQAD